MNKFLVANGFVIVYLVAFELTYQDGPNGNRLSFLWLGLVLGIVAIVTFFYAGSRHILFGSVFSFGHLILVAAPAVSIGLGKDQLRADLKSSVALMYLSVFFLIQIAVFLSSKSVPKQSTKRVVVDERLQLLAVGFGAMGLAAHYFGRVFFAFEVVALAGIILSSLVTFTRPTTGRTILHGLCLTTITALWATYVFSGFGRLLMASMLFSIVIVFSWIHSTYLPKIMTIAATVPAFIILTLQRISYVGERFNQQMDVQDGLVSVFGPFQSGAFVFQQIANGTVAPSHGQSHFTSLLFWIPRAVWGDKPPGFGRAIVPVTQPYMVHNPEHSDAAPYISELVWDFGLLGLAAVPLLIFLIARMDRIITKEVLFADWIGARRNRGFLAASIAAFVAMSLNYVWGGSFTYLTRSMIPALMLLGLFLLSRRRLTGRTEKAALPSVNHAANHRVSLPPTTEVHFR